MMKLIIQKKNEQVRPNDIEISSLIEILKHISTTHRDQFNQRRNTEWQVLISLLTFYLTTTYVILKKEIVLTLFIFHCLILVFSFLALFSTWYLHTIHEKNEKNKAFAEKAEDYLLNMSKRDDLIKLIDPNKISPTVNWSLAWQIVIIFLFAVMNLGVIYFSCFLGKNILLISN